MKIALIGNDYAQQFPLENYGGIESCVENLAYGLHALGKDFFVICPKRTVKKEYPFEIFETEEEPTLISKKNSFYYGYSVSKVLENLKFDIIWSQSHWSIEPLLKFKKPILCTFHDSCDKQYGWIKNINTIRYRFLSKFQFNNWVKEEWENKISFQCYTGLEENEFKLEINKTPYFLWCAGLRWGLEAKGLDLFIKLAEINKKYNFFAYGNGNLDLENYLKSIKISNFYFKGGLPRGDEHKKVFSKAKAFIIPTLIKDTFPRTCLEAVSKGTPIIGSKNGSIPEITDICGGKICESIEEYGEALDQRFNYEGIFNRSKYFSIKNEVNTLIKESEKI